MSGPKQGATALDRLAPYALGLGLFLACFLTPRASPLFAPPPTEECCTPGALSLLDAGSNPIGFLIVAAASAATAALTRRVRWPLYVMAAAAWLLFSLWPVLFIASYAAANRASKRAEVLGWIAIAVTVLGIPFLVGEHYARGSPLIRLYLFVLLLAFDVAVPLFCGLWLRARRRSVERLVAANEQLEATIRAEERNKIAREMHDVVAHRIALIVLHSAAVKNEHGELIGQLGRTALHELRDVLGVLRHGPTQEGERPDVAEVPLHLQLETLVAQAQAAGVPVEMRMEGEALPPPGDAGQVAREHTVLRVAQEALTNVIKHAPGASTVMTVRGGTDTMEIVVENEPRPRKGTVARSHDFPRSGLGLVGLRERVSLLDGTLDTVMRADGGYRVCATLPTAPTPPDPPTPPTPPG